MKLKSLIIAVCMSTQLLLSQSNGKLNIQLDKEGVSLSPSLYGLFFEDINMAGDGGLYAEMIRNRSFEDIRPPEGTRIEGDFAVTPGNFRWYAKVNDSIPSWKLKKEGGAEGSIHLDTANKLNNAQLYALKMCINSNKGKFAVTNEGYWGIAVKKGETYNFSFYARSVKPLAEKIKVTLEDEAGKVYASAEFAGMNTQWKKYSAKLLASDANTKLKLLISATKQNIIWIDMVSLFPQKTWKNRENGMRADIMQVLLDLNPKFLRFPGGCVVEGITFDNAIQWKETIGDVAERPGHLNVWGYRTSDGMGYHEFLQMSEDLGCEPLFVVNVGMTCQARNSYSMPMDQLQPLIQDAIDAIEYANGPVTSKWGALRAKNGHSKPFNLKYFEIGNENWGPDYDQRYEVFYDAIKAKYPDIITIRAAHPTADKNPLFFPNNKGEILDLHYYRSPEWIFKNTNIFDDYERKGKDIYIGEFACNEKVGNGNLYSALADAVFMTAMEKNGDIIKLASFAPLLENEDKDGYKWPVNLIHFNNNQIYGIPSYYAQQMFFKNKGDVTLVSSLVSDSINVPSDIKFRSGAIGFDTYSTESVFDDVLVVKGNDTLMFEDFNDENTKFPLRPSVGTWKIENGVLHQKDAGLFAHAVMGDTSWSNYTVTFKAKRIRGMEGFFMTLLNKGEDNCVHWNIGGWNNTQHAVEYRSNGGSTYIAPMVPGKIKEGVWYNVRMELNSNTLKCFLNDKLIQHVVLPENTVYKRLYSIVVKDKETGTVIVKMVNPFSEPAKVTINLSGTDKISPEGEEILLTSASANDKNSFAEPLKVSPISKKISGLDKNFDYTFKPHSLTFLKLKISL